MQTQNLGYVAGGGGNDLMDAATAQRIEAWNRSALASPGELDLHIDAAQIEGEIPPALRGGRMLSNGPGWTRMGDWNLHPFDSHGYLRSFELLDDGGCRLRARFIDTQVYRDEAAAGRFLHRGLATNLPQWWKNFGMPPTMRNVANTTVTTWNGRLLAGWEGGEPHALDSDSLATIGPETFSGAIAGQATLAHMRHDHQRDRLILCSTSGRSKPSFCFRELDTNDRVVASRSVSIERPGFAHDFAFTPSWYVLLANPTRLDPVGLAKAMLGQGALFGAVGFADTEPGEIHLVPRSGDGPVRTVRLPGPAMVVHFGNAFERDDGTVIIDACVFHRYAFGQEFGYTGPRTPLDPRLPDARDPQQLLRITIPAGASEATWQPLSDHGIDFPRFHPDHEGQDTPWLFGATRADTRHSDPFDSLIRVDLHDRERPASLWTAPEHVFVGEPLFVPDPERDDAGHVLAIASDGLRDRSTLLVLDAAQLEAGPIAQIPMPLLPIAFHGDWAGRA